MAKIETQLEQQLKNNPDQRFDLIVRTKGEVEPHLAWLSSAGLQVKQQFRLTPGAAVSGYGQDALKLLGQDWVISVERDAPVTTM